MADHRNVSTTLRKASRRRAKTGSRLAGKAIVQILPAMEQGGVERGTVAIAEAIIREGGRAIVISNGGKQVPRLLQLGAEHIELPVHAKNPLKWPFIRWRVKRRLAQTGAQLVHVRSRAPAWIAMSAARGLGLPVVTTIHGRFVRANPFKRIYNGIMVRGDRVIAISRYIRDLVREQYPKLGDRLTVIPRGVDLEAFSPDRVGPSRVVRMSSLLSLPDGLPVVMLPARPSSWKGADVLIEAATRVKDIDFMLLLVGAADGDRDYRRRLVSKIKGSGLDGRVKLLEEVDDMPAAMMLADVVAMPSTSPEPFGRVAIESSAMGCPVVAFNHGGAVESIRHGVTGFLAKPNDAESLAVCLRDALRLDDRERLQLSRDAREFIAGNYSSEQMCDKTITVYEKLLRRRRSK